MEKRIPTEVSEVKLIYRSKVKAANRPPITCSYDAYKILKTHWDDDTIGLFEEFYVLLLDRSNRVMGRYRVSQGGLSGTVVDAKMIFAAALKARASTLILSHNHPSGNLQPSQADRDLTDKIRQAGKLLDLPILDHLILSPEGGYYSFTDEGLI